HIEKWTHSRGAAIAIIYLLLVVLLVTFFFFVGPQIGRQAQRLSGALPDLLNNVGNGEIAQQIGREHGWSATTIAQLQRFLVSHREYLIGIAQNVGLRLAEAAKQSWLLIVVPVLAAFFLKDGRAFNDTLLSFARTRPQREFLQ